MRLLAINGSLRAESSNGAILKTLAALAPSGVVLEVYDGLGTLPHFNPDLDGEGAVAPPTVAELRARLAAADGVVVCSPEYAHGAPGSLKNALDWLVSVGELVGKPIVVITASPSGGKWPFGQLVETLTVMSWRVVLEGCLSLTFSRRHVDDQGRVGDAELRAQLAGSLAALVAASA